MNDFQERLQELLIDGGLNRSQLANKLNISSTTINGYFNNGYYPQLDIALNIAKYFNCSLDYLFGLSDKKQRLNNSTSTFIQNLDNLIQTNKLTKSKALSQLSMSEYNYYRWKDGQVPRTINLIDIAKYFDVSLDWLVGKTNNQ